MWRAEDPATKAHYKAMSQRNMEKYKMDMEAYYNRKFISFLEKPRTFDDYWITRNTNKKLANIISFVSDFHFRYANLHFPNKKI